MWKHVTGLIIALQMLGISSAVSQTLNPGEIEILEMLKEDRPYHVVSPELFDRLGWSLPDAGRTVKMLADQASGSAPDPREIESLSAEVVGYTSRWHELRYEAYGLDWDITGLHMIPQHPVANMPTLVIIHGGSTNWYEYVLDPFNNPGLAQYLAQKIPVLLVTIPGNYRPGGWTERVEDRTPVYLLDRDISKEELKVRNASFTFKMVADGVRKLIESVTVGPVVVVGHSTGGEIPYMLQHTSLQNRMHGLVLGWASGGTSSQSAMQQRWGYTQTADTFPPVGELRARLAEGHAGDYLGPLNPVWDATKTREDMAKRWMAELEFERRPHFKQPLQDMERRGEVPGMREEVMRQVQETLTGNAFGVDTESVVADLFAPMRVPLTGYRKIILTAASMDTGHWDKDNPDESSTVEVANELRQLNPDIPVRVLLFDVPMTHYGHLEKPQQLAAGLFSALYWLVNK
jgi:pimeloyl-ACP methyl ester carboxylesterase